MLENVDNEYLNFESLSNIQETLDLLKEHNIKEITIEHESDENFIKLQKLGWVIFGMVELNNRYCWFSGEHKTRPAFLLRYVL